MAHKHQPRWTQPDRLDLLDLDDDELHGCIVAVAQPPREPSDMWEWTCQHCEAQGLYPGPDPAGAWSAFLDHERSKHLEPSECQTCATPLTQPATGRPRRYCSDACRQAAHRART